MYLEPSQYTAVLVAQSDTIIGLDIDQHVM
jgi:hypothetical protein